MTSRSGRLAACALGAVVVAVALMSSVAVSADIKASASRKGAPRLSLKDATGTAIRLSDYKGKVVLLDFWATWCAGCKTEIPWFVEFQQKYKSQGLTSIGVAMDEEGWQLVKPYLVEHPISYPVVLGDLDLMQKRFGLDPSLPVTLLIDRNGRIAATHPGLVEKDAFEREIQQLLREKGQ